MFVLGSIAIYALVSFIFFKWLLYSTSTKEMVVRVIFKHKKDYPVEEIIISIISSFLVFHTIVSAIAMLIFLLLK